MFLCIHGIATANYRKNQAAPDFQLNSLGKGKIPQTQEYPVSSGTHLRNLEPSKWMLTIQLARVYVIQFAGEKPLHH